ncbi:MAG TPA: o-succinylbenzoate--CoA ligase [Gemmatimonadaceae bacterium]|nr:o-succinylbenzoate--CoA ligase [Gemmatimonadaceae bacterium]
MIEGPSRFADWIASHAATRPDQIALLAAGESWTFEQLDAEITRTARRLAGLGVEPGDRIVTLLQNGLVAAVLPHATLRLGATLVPLNVRLTDSELAWQIRDAAPRLIIVEASTLRSIQSTRNSGITIVSITEDPAQNLNTAAFGECGEADVELRLDHPADAVLAVIYTSGTTGTPKGAMLSVGNFWWSAIGSALNLGSEHDDRWLACLPLFHVGGLSIVMRSAIYGITAVVHDGFDPKAVNEAMDNDAVTIASVVPVMLQRMLDARGDRPYPPTLRCVLVGGGPVPKTLLERCASLGVPVVQTYGLTECCSQVATLSPDEALDRIGSAGKALTPNEIRVVTSDGNQAAADEAGEILVRGPVVMAGYSGQPEATLRAIVDGWLRTGDIGRIDADGYLYVLDRRDDLIITGGENVYPAEVEAVLQSHPSIDEVAVIGVNDAEWGQRIVAIARLGDGLDADPATLQIFCRERLAGYKVPSEFRFVSGPLPRTASGKLRRIALRGDAPTR